MNRQQLSITCPLCGRKYERPVESLVEGAELVCPHCKVKLNLHGHMLEDLHNEIAKLKK